MIKEKFIIYLGGVSIFFMPIIPFMALTGFVVMLDMWIGIRASKRLGIPITSRRAKDTITKGIVYASALIVFHACEVLFKLPIPMLEVTGGLIVYTELTSIDENYHALTGKKFFAQLKRFLKTNSNPEDENKPSKPK